MKILTQGSTAFDGQQAVQLSADASGTESASVDAPIEMTAAENAGLNGLASASAASAMLSERDSTDVPKATAFTSGLPAPEATESGLAPSGLIGQPTGSTFQPSTAPALSTSGTDALNALVQDTAMLAASLTVTFDDIDPGEGAAATAGPEAQAPVKKRGNSRASAQPIVPDSPAEVATPIESTPSPSASGSRRLPIGSTEISNVQTNSLLEAGFKPIASPLRDQVQAVSAEFASAGENLIASLVDGSSESASPPVQLPGRAIQTSDSSQNQIPVADDGTNMAQLRALGLLPQEPQEPITLSSNVAFYEAQPDSALAQAPQAKKGVVVDIPAPFAQPESSASVAAARTTADGALERLNEPALLSKQIAKSASDSLLAALQNTSLRPGDVEEISGPLSDQVVEDPAKGQRTLVRQNSAAAEAVGVPDQAGKSISDETVDGQIARLSKQIEKSTSDNFLAALQNTSLRPGDVEEISGPLSDQIAEEAFRNQRPVVRQDSATGAEAASISDQSSKSLLSEELADRLSARLSKQIEKATSDNFLAALQNTSLRPGDVEEISGPLSEQVVEDVSENQRVITRQNSATAAETAGLLDQASKAISEELAARQRAFVVARQESLSVIDTTQAAVDAAAAAAAQLQRQRGFSSSADVESLASRQSGKQTSSQDEHSSSKNSVNSVTGGDADGDISILKAYQPPLFNRRLETNGVDDALILLIASLKETGSGRAVEPIMVPLVTAVPIVLAKEESPEERAAEAVLPELAEEKRKWLRTSPHLRRPYYYFDSDAFERASRETLQQRPEMQRRRPQNPIMSDPRSTGVAERAAFWVLADVGRAGSHRRTQHLTTSATMSHRALHPSWMQPLAEPQVMF